MHVYIQSDHLFFGNKRMSPKEKKKEEKKKERITLEACGLADFPLFSFLQHKPLFSPPPAPPDY